MDADGGAWLRREADGIAEVVLDRPAAMNALSTATLLRVTEFFTMLAGEQATSAVVLSAEGERAFCAGADLKERAAMSDAEIMAQRPVFRAAFGALLALPQPAIAAVHGFALGGGCELALSCDVIVADQTAELGLPEASVGLVPGCGGTQLLGRRVGPGLAAELIFTGRRVGAAEAVAIGLVDRVVPAGTARASALAMARQIAANSPVAVRAAKRALRNGAALGLAAALDVEDAAWRTAASSADRREGIAAFAGKRRPVWPSLAGQPEPERPAPDAGDPRSAPADAHAGEPRSAPADSHAGEPRSAGAGAYPGEPRSAGAGAPPGEPRSAPADVHPGEPPQERRPAVA